MKWQLQQRLKTIWYLLIEGGVDELRAFYRQEAKVGSLPGFVGLSNMENFNILWGGGLRQGPTLYLADPQT